MLDDPIVQLVVSKDAFVNSNQCCISVDTYEASDPERESKHYHRIKHPDVYAKFERICRDYAK